MTLQTSRRIRLVSGSLRLMACALENTTDVREWRGILLAIENAAVLIKMCLYEFQTDLIANAKHDFGSNDNDNTGGK